LLDFKCEWWLSFISIMNKKDVKFIREVTH
jgi:hypothetical protein